VSESEVDKYAVMTEDGILAYETRNYKAAIELLLKVTDKQSDNWVAKLYLGLAYSKSGDQLLARSIFRFLISRCPNTDIKARAEAYFGVSDPTPLSVGAWKAPTARPAPAEDKPAPVRLQALVDTVSGRRHPLSDPKISIGSDPQNQIVLSKDPFISRVQAIIIRDANDFFLENSIVVNATKLNGKALNERTKLAHGDAIKLGKTTFRVE
jgi:hypothetical protein